MTVAHALREAAAVLGATSDTPRLDVELLMAQALAVSRSELLLRHLRDPAPTAFTALLDRRIAHEPIAYILGQQEFFGLEFRVSPAVLIPRADSEVLVETAIACHPDALTVLDCGTGSGALLLAVLTMLPQARGIGVDRSEAALAIAGGNAARLGLSTRARMAAVDWDQPGWADSLGGPFDLILANPPYVEADACLAPSVAAHEPAGALFAGPEGLDAYRILLPQLPALLTPDGIAFVEIGASQAEAVTALAQASGFTIKLHRDLGGRARLLELRSCEKFSLGKSPGIA
jgi:release factor glutamine methyltransferase